MTDKNFILTDLMNLEYHQDLKKFLSYCKIEKQEIDLTHQYYMLHTYNLDGYKRKFVCCFPRFRLLENEDYSHDLNKRLKKLISLNFKLIMTDPWESKYTIEEKIKKNKNIFSVNHTKWSGESSWFWMLMYEKYKDKKLNIDHSIKLYDFLYLNKNPREHRLNLFEKIKKENILDNSLFSFTRKGIKLKKEYELPWVDIKNYPDMGSDQDIYELPYNHSFCSIVSETHIHDEIFITEKIWKPIITQQLFVVYGKAKYLKDLRELGFQTFHNIMDESYDEETDPEKRIEKIIKLCKWLKRQNYKELYEKTEGIRRHNREHFFNKEALTLAVNKTILGFLKFADRS